MNGAQVQEINKPTLAVICRLNQARSIVVAAYLARVLPNYRIVSAGIQAIDGQRIPMSVTLLAENWGIPIAKDYSDSIESIQKEIMQAELVIVAEDLFAQSIVDLGLAASKIESMQSSIFDPDQIPIDPVNLNNDSFEVELAKAIMVSGQLVKKKNLVSSHNQITVVFPEPDSDFHDSIQNLLELAKKSEASVLVADFRFPHTQIIEKMQLPYQELSINKVSGKISTNLDQLDFSTPCLIASKYEIDFVEEFVLSTHFSELLRSMSKERPVYVLTGQRSSAHRQFSEPYLIASHNNVK